MGFGRQPRARRGRPAARLITPGAPAVAGRAPVALFLVAVLTACGTAAPSPSATPSPLAIATATAAPTPTLPPPSTTSPQATGSVPTWAVACGTVSDFVHTAPTGNGSMVLSSPARSPLRVTLTVAHSNPEGSLANYVCAALDAGVPYPTFAGLVLSGTDGFIAEGTYPATKAKPAPIGFVVPQACAFVVPPEVSADQTDWKVDCGAEANRNARGTLGPALRQQGWADCGPAVATEQYVKGTVRIVVVESSLAPGDYPRFSQSARAAAGCG